MAQPHPRSPQQNLRTSKWLWAGFATLTVALVTSVLVVFVDLRALGAQLNEMGTARTRSTAARETQINALDFVLDVHRYLETGDERLRRSAVDEADRTERAWADYERLAASERHRGLATRLSTIWVEQKRLGETLMDRRDAQRPEQDLARFDDLSRQLEDLLDQDVQRDAEEEYRVQSETAFRKAENAIA